jgi:DNA-binding transcriptional LysR family regulator
LILMTDLNLNQLHSFVEVIACGSFSKAAIRLGVTQPAVSLHVRNLERRLGVRLIERVAKRAMPTAAGRDLLESAHRLEREVEAAVRQVQGHAGGRRGRVRIGTGATASIYLLPQVLSALLSAHPDLEVKVITGNTPEMLDALEDNTIDMALVTLPASRRTLVVRRLFEESLVAVLPAGERAAPRVVRPDSLPGRRLILYERGGTIRAAIDKWLATSGSRVTPVMELGNVEATKRFVAAGLGCSILPATAVVSEKRDPRILVRPLRPALTRTLGLALRHDKIIDKVLRETITAIERLSSRFPNQ